MNFNNSALTYGMLIIPAFFALTMVGQGLVKIGKSEADGPVATGLGVLLLILIAAAYWFFIR